MRKAIFTAVLSVLAISAQAGMPIGVCSRQAQTACKTQLENKEAYQQCVESIMDVCMAGPNYLVAKSCQEECEMKPEGLKVLCLQKCGYSEL